MYFYIIATNTHTHIPATTHRIKGLLDEVGDLFDGKQPPAHGTHHGAREELRVGHQDKRERQSVHRQEPRRVSADEIR